MEKYYSIYYDLFKSLYQQMKIALEGVPPMGLDWLPGPEMNSMAVLSAHSSGSARFLIGDIVGGISSKRDRDAEFSTAGVDAQQLVQHLEQTMEVIKTVLEGLTLADLQGTRISPRDGSEKAVGWCLTHGLEHFAQHTGHIQITRQLWDQRSK